MMTGTPIESNVWMAYLLTVFLVVTGFAVYDILYRRVPDRALVFFIPLAALAPLIQVYFILEYDWMPIFIWPVVTEALMGALLGFCIPLAAAMATGGSGMGGTNKALAPSCTGARLLEGKVFRSNTSTDTLREWVKTLK